MTTFSSTRKATTMPVKFHDPEWVCDECGMRRVAEDPEDRGEFPLPLGWIDVERGYYDENDQFTFCSWSCLAQNIIAEDAAFVRSRVREGRKSERASEIAEAPHTIDPHQCGAKSNQE